MLTTVTIRKLKPETKLRLQQRAKNGGWSLEEEVRRTLDRSVEVDAKRKGLGTRINEMFKEVGGADDVVAYPRSKFGPPMDFPE
jgi:plasmid stability protein